MDSTQRLEGYEVRLRVSVFGIASDPTNKQEHYRRAHGILREMNYTRLISFQEYYRRYQGLKVLVASDAKTAEIELED